MQDILSQRLSNQLLSASSTSSVYDIVRHMTCMQAQDFAQHKRAIASRFAGFCLPSDIEKVYHDGLIVRTRTQRGTLHVVAAEDAGWIVKLCASKTLSGFQRRRAFLGISDETLEKSVQLIQTMLEQGPLTRTEIVTQLKESCIPMQNGRGYHILCYMGTLGLTVQGPMREKEQAFVLASQWIKNPKILTEDESLAELTFRYFSSHGPATIADFQWWSGLGVGQIKRGIEMCGEQIIKEGEHYYNAKFKMQNSKLSNDIHFLAGFDEWLLGYKDRRATLDIAHHTLVDVSRNGVFKPTVMIDGKTLGTRSTKIKKDFCEVFIKPFDVLSDGDFEFLQKASQKYGEYLEKPVRVTML